MNVKVRKGHYMLMKLLVRWWGVVDHRTQDMRKRGDSGTEDSRKRARETTIRLREEGSLS
jgi:hypothetical protein